MRVNPYQFWRTWIIGHLAREIPRAPRELYAHIERSDDPLGSRIREAIGAMVWYESQGDQNADALVKLATEMCESVVRRFRRVAA